MKMEAGKWQLQFDELTALIQSLEAMEVLACPSLRLFWWSN